MSKYRITKVLSNNVVLVRQAEKKYILVGKGIGFGKKKGAIINNNKHIEERFISLEELSEHERESFLDKIDPAIIELADEIIAMVSEELDEDLNPKIHLGLIDHVNFAIQRIKEGIEIVNPFLFETKLLYPVEYALAERAVAILKAKLNISIPDAEIGFIALHIYGGRNNSSKTDALKRSKLTKDITEFIESKLGVQMKRYPYAYSRLIMHLRGVMDRVIHDKSVENILLSKLKEDLAYEISLAETIGKIIQKTFGKKVSESEIGYIALHLHKLNQQI